MIDQNFKNLIDYFSKFPGIGTRQAMRFVFYLIYQPKKETFDFIEAIKNLKEKVRICPSCFFIAENGSVLDKNFVKCRICSDEKRFKNLICVVEKESDVMAIEKTGKFKGVYHVLGGLIFSANHKKQNKLRTKELIERIKKLDLKQAEIILALNPTTEGDATSLYLERMLKSFNIKISRLARGLPKGGDIEYADEETIENAIKNRTLN